MLRWIGLADHGIRPGREIHRIAPKRDGFRKSLVESDIFGRGFDVPDLPRLDAKLPESGRKLSDA
ncbi:hypothetical protein D3C80_1916330 [compost metagenome]